MKKKQKISSYIFPIINNCVMSVLAFACLFPFLYMFMVSLIPTSDYMQYGITFPRHITLDNFKVFLGSGSRIYTAYGVTIFITIVGTLVGIALTASLAYPLSKKYLPGRKWINLMLIITMVFNAGMIPRYLVVKNLGLTNTLWSIIIPQAVAVWYVFLMRNFFSDIPTSLEESVKIDGAGDFTILVKIYLPLSKASIATIGLFYAVGRWNEWYDALLFITDTDKQPLQLVLRNIISFSQSALNPGGMKAGVQMPPNEIVKMTAILVAVLPILCVYPFIQKYFVKGAMVGSIKE